jgi:Holliday junction resolvase YEN1
MPKGAMDRFVKVTKSVDESGKENEHAGPFKSSEKVFPSSQPALPPVYLAPTLEKPSYSQLAPTTTSSRTLKATLRATRSSAGPGTHAAPATKSTRNKKAIAQKPAPNTNPWTIAASSPQSNPRVHKPISQQPKSSSPLKFKRTAIYIDSSPPVPASSAPSGLESPSSPRKHQHSPTPPLDYDAEPELPPTIRLTRGSHTSTEEFGTPTKNTKDIDRPSPKKKISPDLSERRGSACRRSISEPPGPESVAQKLDFTDLGSHIHEKEIERWQSFRTSVSQKVEDPFQFELASCDKSAADLLDLPRAKDWLPTLPSTSDLVPASAKEAEVIDLASSPASRAVPAIETGERGEMASPPKPKPKPKKYTMVRESTDGTFWEGVGEEQFKRRSNVNRYSQVEVLDLTSDD